MIENTESVETNTSEGVVEANTSEPVVETKTSEEVTKTDETAEKTSKNSLINPKVEDKPTEDSKSEDSGVPDEYIFDFSKVEGLEDVKIDADDPAMEFMKPAFQDLGLTQEKANKLVEAYSKYVKSFTETADEIKSNLGKDADTMINQLQNFSDKLSSQDDRELFASLCDSTENVKFFHRYFVGKAPAFAGAEANVTGVSDNKENALQEALKFREDNLDKFEKNLSIQEQYNKLLKKAENNN